MSEKFFGKTPCDSFSLEEFPLLIIWKVKQNKIVSRQFLKHFENQNYPVAECIFCVCFDLISQTEKEFTLNIIKKHIVQLYYNLKAVFILQLTHCSISTVLRV